MTYTRTGPFANNSAPYLDAGFFNKVEDGLVAANGGPKVISAESVGVAASGADVSAAFTALLAGITSYTLVKLPTGTINLGSATFNIDVSLVSFVGDRTVLTGTGTVNMYSTVSYSTRQQNWGAVTRGVIFQSLTLTIGHATYGTVGMFRFVDGGAIGATINVISNAWKIVWDHFHVQGGSVTAPAGSGNAGENMILQGCMIADGVTLAINNNGDWHFIGCSLDNTLLQVANANVYLDNCHFENPGSVSSGFRMVSIAATGSVTITNTQLVINDPGSVDWTMAPFYVDPGNTLGGLVVRNMQVPRGDWIRPEVTDGVPVLVGGGGRAFFDGITTYTAGSATFALAEANNAVANGTAESGTVGWSTIGSVVWSIDSIAGNHNRGSSSHKVTVAASQTGTFYQDIPAAPGRLLFAQLWRKYTIGAGGSINSQLYFLDRLGNVISTTDFDQATANLAGGFKPFLQLVPPGAAVCRINFFLTGGTGGVTAYVDDVITNLA